ncbi:MAG: pyrroloquinoline quinone biosynthesis protein PqqB [Bacteroidetes bacterium]|nr:MAG: pyrroloquinoline quinone biosynthesis protein PqqB [Bacteroidota bacterium]
MYRLLLLLLLAACSPGSPEKQPDLSLLILGVAQDGGYPHVGCEKNCCQLYWDGKQPERTPTCLAVLDRRSGQAWMLEATPAYTDQFERLREAAGWTGRNAPDGIFLTHAHIGHYTGLMYLGREALGADSVPVYAMPRMKKYLETNGPWSQLVGLGNVELKPIQAEKPVAVNAEIRVTPFRVPHRDEYSETVGYRLAIAGKQVLFIPDIDKWEKWDRDIVQEIKSVDLAFLDATFYKNGELKRDMSEIPHPFIEESMQRFDSLTVEEKARVHFIHFNHTNPMLWDEAAVQEVESRGFKIAREGTEISF